MKTRHLVCALLATVLDVRVHAAVFEEPSHCLKSPSARCAVMAASGFHELELESQSSVRLAKGSAVIRDSEGRLELVRGTFLVEAGDHPVGVKSIYAHFEVSSGAALIEVTDSRVRYFNISSRMTYRPLGERSSHVLPIGYSSESSKVLISGVADTAYPRPAELESLIHSWAKVYGRKEKADFVASLKDFTHEWRSTTRTVGTWYLDTVQRSIAAHEAELARQARLKANRERENSRYREMLRRRLFE
jgi:hypothetical protein